MTEVTSKGPMGKYVYFILTLIDLLVINAAFLVVMKLNGTSFSSQTFRGALLALNFAYIPCIFWIRRFDYLLHAIQMQTVLSNAFKVVAGHAAAFMALSLFLHLDYRVLVYIELYAIILVALPIAWVSARNWVKAMRRRGRNETNVVIIGTSWNGRRLAREMLSDRGFGFNILGHFDNEISPAFDGVYLGKIDKLNEFLTNNRVDQIYFTIPEDKVETLSMTARIAEKHLAAFFYVPRISKYVSSRFDISEIGTMPVLSMRRNPLRNPLNRVLKRSFDIAFSSAFLIVSPLVFIPIAIAIKRTSPGPIFFVQERTGYMGRSFKCLKFRTMRVNTEADVTQATADDPRKTKIGDFLRRTSLDELPQFINVWKGDMSVVGPRPHMLKHTEDYSRLVDRYMMRHVVKPGITGWAQVNGYRGLTDELWKMEKRVQYDVWYVENWAFWLDIKIIGRTMLNGLKGEDNAY